MRLVAVVAVALQHRLVLRFGRSTYHLLQFAVAAEAQAYLLLLQDCVLHGGVTSVAETAVFRLEGWVDVHFPVIVRGERLLLVTVEAQIPQRALEEGGALFVAGSAVTIGKRIVLHRK